MRQPSPAAGRTASRSNASLHPGARDRSDECRRDSYGGGRPLPTRRIRPGDRVDRTCDRLAAGPADVAQHLVKAKFVARERSRDIEYRNWIERFDNPSAATIARWRSDAARQAPMTISIAMPTYNSPERWLRACLDSVLAQTWPHWELCIADDASTLAMTRSTLDEYAKRDWRIRVEYRLENGGIAAASNTALGLVTENLLRSSTMTTRSRRGLSSWLRRPSPGTRTRCCYTAMKTRSTNRAGAISRISARLGSGAADGAKLHQPSQRLSGGGPAFVGRIQARLRRCAGLGPRAARQRNDRSKHIVHVPHVLYHWRAIEGSTARAMQSKAYAESAQQRAVASHVARTGAQATIIRAVNGAFLQADPILALGPPKVCLVILQSGTGERDGRTERWRELARAAGHDAVFVRTGAAASAISDVDAAPPAIDSRARRRSMRRSRVWTPKWSFWSTRVLLRWRQTGSTCWFATRRKRPSVWSARCCTMESGARFMPDISWIRIWSPHRLMSALRAIGSRQEYGAGRAESVRRRPRLHGRSKRLWIEVGGLDTTMLRARYRDVDFCLRLADNGYRNRWHPGAELAYAYPLRSQQHPFR